MGLHSPFAADGEAADSADVLWQRRNNAKAKCLHDMYSITAGDSSHTWALSRNIMQFRNVTLKFIHKKCSSIT